MDTKALAKSKRAHSLHHTPKRPHSNQKSKAPSTSTSDAGTGNKKVREKAAAAAQQSALPSNWDRYYEDDFDDLDSEKPRSGDTASKPKPSDVDVVLPKSKGADYRHLVAEAQSQSLLGHSYSDLDDVLRGIFLLLSAFIYLFIRDDRIFFHV